MSHNKCYVYVLSKRLVCKNQFIFLHQESVNVSGKFFFCNFLGWNCTNEPLKKVEKKKNCMMFQNTTLNLNIKQNVLCLRVALWRLFYAVLHIIVLSNLFFASVAGLLTVLLYFLAFVLCALTLHPEDAECAANNSEAHIGERLVTEKDYFLLLSSKTAMLFHLKLAYFH